MENKQNNIKLGTHGEEYGNWMSSPVFYIIGAICALSFMLAYVFFNFTNISFLAYIFLIVAIILVIMLIWMAYVRNEYSFKGGNLMAKIYSYILNNLDYDGKGTLLEVGCGSGALSIRAAKTWPKTKVIGLDYWAAVYNYSKEMCEKNATSEGVKDQCEFSHGDARKIDMADESVDALISNYVYHNITGFDKQELLLESLRVLKKGGVFAINDCMRPSLYGDMDAFAQKLRDMGYEDVHFIDTTKEIFGSNAKASLLFLSGSKMIVGRK